jgi:hypothetical protein
MSEEYPILPGFEQMLQNRIAQKASLSGQLPPSETVDPYKLMLQRKNGDPTLPMVQQWPEEDVKELDAFCQKNGIIGVSSRMNPKLVLMQLKRQVGDYTDVPLEERCPLGYERRGTPNKYGPTYPYSEALTKKQILHG